ncbi:MAG: sodium:solute symporter family transporter [Pirellulales bacterium]
MGALDVSVIVLYFVLVIGAGFWYQKRASKDLEAYFLGGKGIHWLALAISGASSNFDVTGTMWIVTLLALFGMKSMWNHWMWGFLMGAFFLAFMGKWVRRSGVITGAEWMVTRFGNGRDGRTARTAYALMAVVTLAAFLGYGFEGIGKFISVYTGWNPQACAAAMFGVTTLYVMLGGLYSVVITDIIQTTILTIASVAIAVLAYMKLSPEMLSRLPADWSSLAPAWRLEESAQLAGTSYEGYELFGALVIVWVLKGFLLNLGGPAQMADFQRFLAARDPRDAAKVGAAWSGFLIVRWAMATGIALLAIQAGTRYAADPEKFMPLVLQNDMPQGLRGLVIAGLLAAFMASFSAMVNAGASYVVRDFWQPLFFPHAGKRHLIWASYVATLALVAVGIAIGLRAESIRAVFDWIMMALGAAFAIPNVLRWYWWRMNGWGYAIGTLVGLIGALATPFVPWLALPYVSFPAVCSLSLVACLAATMLTRPTEEAVLVGFYRNVRPFGFWGHIRRQAGLSAAELDAPSESVVLAVVNTILGGVAILGAYLCPMYLVGHWHSQSLVCLGMAAAAIAALYFTWYRNLPAPEVEPALADQGVAACGSVELGTALGESSG